MSIYVELGARVNEGRLFAVPPPDLPGSTMERQLFVSQRIQMLLEGPWVNQEWAERCWGLEADLHRYVLGEMIAVRLPPSKSVAAYLALLEQPAPPKDKVWELRSCVDPQLRLFGQFAEKNRFVALTWEYRSYLGNDADKWYAAMEECKAEWRKLFPAYDPLLGEHVHDYVSKKFIVV